ncbi:hypothetical protein L226DRAFT_467302 [Lentinus tigrinus ALCF2SS1-7]|uniref:F-box domain-containing protein n=1 Tax=Lentinus tigrinus ALCF2SS1-6 TaxID=1328759 RepID=A0A5C2S9L8_9APHY|nr:hypothetical protein L227DRAFT_630144 [Lentinus tigrinus ALCF2SS1-6]RPD72285.1 hypothetical protein L226DRAFT_467302 [Lentinus tigrinus ALCF2SS1-7]
MFAEGIVARQLTLAALPAELVLNIFKATVGPLHERDSSIVHGRHNPWLCELRTKLALPLVCRATLTTGMCVLYEDVVIRRMGQIPALARTLRSPTGLGCLIRSIRIDSCPVWTRCSLVVQEDLQFILAQCTALRSFCHRPHPQFSFLQHSLC